LLGENELLWAFEWKGGRGLSPVEGQRGAEAVDIFIARPTCLFTWAEDERELRVQEALGVSECCWQGCSCPPSCWDIFSPVNVLGVHGRRVRRACRIPIVGLRWTKRASSGRLLCL